jgi:type II secretory pathway pseudopilin PulG
MMIVVAIMAVLVSIAIPTYAKLRRDAKARVCRANIKQIEGAIDQWSFDYDVDEGTSLSPNKDEIYFYLVGGEPVCPSGGVYVLTNLGDNPQVLCSTGLEGHEYP